MALYEVLFKGNYHYGLKTHTFLSNLIKDIASKLIILGIVLTICYYFSLFEQTNISIVTSHDVSRLDYDIDQ